MSRLRRILTFPNTVAAVVCALMLPPAYWLIIDREPVASSVSEVLSADVRQGDFLQIDYDVVWASRCEIVAFRYIIDEMQVEWPISRSERVVEKGRQKFTIRVPVPMAAAPGKAVYKGTLRFACNPMQRLFPLEQDLRPREFTIIENKEMAWRRRKDVQGSAPSQRRFAGLW